MLSYHDSLLAPVPSLNIPKIALIDDDPYSRLAALDILQLDRYEVLESDGNHDIPTWIATQEVDLVLMDVCLGGQDGIKICQILKSNPQTANIPVIVMSVMDDPQNRARSRESGADAYLSKPPDRFDLLNRIDLLIQKKQLAESLSQVEQVLFRVAQVIEQRYAVAGQRVGMSDLVASFGRFLKLDTREIEDLMFAARLHDLGMIQVPDVIMLKSGNLSPDELTVVKEHVQVGAKIFEPLLQRQSVCNIMRYHHERWDGSGYPERLQGDAIPYLAQVFQIIDIFCALTNPRRHKSAITAEQAIDVLQKERNKGWRNPELIRQFVTFLQQSESSE